MKLRIKDNSIRLRLTQTDVATLATNGVVAERVNFTASSALSYQLQVAENISQPSVNFVNNRITVFIPKDFAAQWPVNNVTGTNALCKSADGTEIFILIEKDFKCLDNTSEDQSDNFVNPKSIGQ